MCIVTVFFRPVVLYSSSSIKGTDCSQTLQSYQSPFLITVVFSVHVLQLGGRENVTLSFQSVSSGWVVGS